MALTVNKRRYEYDMPVLGHRHGDCAWIGRLKARRKGHDQAGGSC